jgi:endo-1,4-beta-xylanase
MRMLAKFSALLLAAVLWSQEARPPWMEPTREEPPGTQYWTFESAAAGGKVSYLIHLPPAYAASGRRRYPVLYWLHGGGGNQKSGAAFIPALAAAQKAGKAPHMIVVLVNGLAGSLYIDSSGGQQPVETMIIQDLIPHIDRTYRTIGKRAGRGIEGFSMGGYGAARLAFKYPEKFALMSSLAGAVLDVERFSKMPNIFNGPFGGRRDYFEEVHPFTWARANAAIRGMAIRIVVGQQDTGRGTFDANQEFHRLLTDLRLPHQYTLVEGVKHSYRRLYEKLGDSGFEFFRKGFAEARQ